MSTPDGPSRIQSIDMIKGLALVLISAGYLNWYIPSPSDLFVFLASVEAPLFYFAAGYTMAIRAADRPLSFFVWRMVFLFAFKAFIDVAIFGILPLVDGSSLITIALGCPVIFALSRVPTKGRFGHWPYAAGLGTITLLMPVAQKLFGYRQLQTNVDYWYNYPSLLTQISNIHSISDVLRNWLIDGWNPFFPFVGFMLLGAYIESIRRKLIAKRALTLATLTLITLICYAVWPLAAPEPIPRLGQLELQFPPSVIFVLAFGCLATLGFVIFESASAKRFLQPLSPIGQSPLFNFILISALVRLVVYPRFGAKMTMSQFLGVWAGINVTVFATTYVLGGLSTLWITKHSPLFIRMLFGSDRNSLFRRNSHESKNNS